MMSLWGSGILINKGRGWNNFIFLISILVLWLWIHILSIDYNFRLYYLFFILNVIVLLAIKTKGLLNFYIIFEASVIPITLIVFKFGYQPEKLQASLYLLLYTVSRSLPLLLFIIYAQDIRVNSSILSLAMTLGFMVKTPMYLLHTWLPKAHVEAPVGGSMVLAGILLKLGSYGLLLFLPLIRFNCTLTIYLGCTLLGSIICSLICVRQGDLKLLIAYSSVVHMGFVSLGFLTGSEVGYCCGVIMVVRHGLSSPFLFVLAHCLYCTSHSRLLVNNMCSRPITLAVAFGLVSLNIRVPPSVGLWAEVLGVVRIICLASTTLPLLILIFLLSALYNLYLYVSVFHSKSIEGTVLSPVALLGCGQVIVISYLIFIGLDLFHL